MVGDVGRLSRLLRVSLGDQWLAVPCLDALGVLLRPVMVRGLERRTVFRDDRDRADFVRRVAGLAEVRARTVLAWTVVRNHAHRLLLTHRYRQFLRASHAPLN